MKTITTILFLIIALSLSAQQSNSPQQLQLLTRNDSTFVVQGQNQTYVNEEILTSLANSKQEEIKQTAEREKLIIELLAIRDKKQQQQTELNEIVRLLNGIRNKKKE